MTWLVVLLLTFFVWLIEATFGWLFGGQLRWIVFAGIIIYFARAINKLKTSQTELEKELKRLRQTVRTLKTSQQTSPENGSVTVFEREQTHPTYPPEPTVKVEEVEQTLPPEPPNSFDIPVMQGTFKPVITEEMAPKTDYYKEEPLSPDMLDEWLSGGNWIVRSGLAILFIGLAFLAKFAYDNALLPLELRLAAIAAFGIALLIIGWRSRLDRPTYGLSLQGGGVAVLYLTVFATSKMTLLLPMQLAFILMLSVVILAAWLAIQQNAMILAVIGTMGGFMAPVLLSTGQGSHIGLFSYFAVLNVGIMAVALHKAWRPLNLLAFFFTYGIAGLWGMQRYQPGFLWSCLLFLGLFYALFTLLCLLFTRHQAQQGENARAIDATLLFGVPTVTFGYALYLLEPYEYGAAWAALFLSACYLSLALFTRSRVNLQQLNAPWSALSLLFATVAVPLAFDARVTSSVWALEGAAVVSYAWQQMQTKTRYFGYLLVFLGSLAFITRWPEVPNSVPILNALSLGLLLLMLAYAVIGIAINRSGGPSRNNVDEAKSVSWVMACALAFTGALVIVTELYPRNSDVTAGILAPALLWLWALVLQKLAKSAQWSQTTAPVIVVPLLTLLLPLKSIWTQDILSSQGLFLTGFALLALLVWQAWVLKKLLPDLWEHFAGETIYTFLRGLPGVTLVAFWWLILVQGRWVWNGLLFPEAGLTMSNWLFPLAAALPIALLGWLGSFKKTAASAVASPALWRWLHGAEELPAGSLEQQCNGFLLLALLYMGSTSLFFSGHEQGFPYFPLINLHELVVLEAFVAIGAVMKNAALRPQLSLVPSTKILAGMGFVFANSILSRILSHYYAADFAMGFAWNSAIAATSYSIAWSVTALIMMWFASQRVRRGLWITGAILLGIVAVKLLLVDLANVGSLARIVSFIGVGVLMLVVGYVAPIPAEAAGNKATY